MLRLADSHILSIKPYVPGRPVENDPTITVWAKLASNENCSGPSPMAINAIRETLNQSHLYPNAKRLLVVERIIEHLKEFSIATNQVAIGNGTSELIVNVVRSVVGPDEAVMYCSPTFVMYALAAGAHGREHVAVPLKEDMSYDVDVLIESITNRHNQRPVKLVFLANPNNPTGKYLTHKELRELTERMPPDVVLVIDEAYFEYVTEEDYANGLVYALARPRTVVLRTFSKIYGLAGLRLGYAIGDAQIVELLCRIRDAFNVNALAQNAAIAAMDDHEHVTNSINHNQEMKPFLVQGLTKLGFTVCQGAGNFVMAKPSAAMPPIEEISERLYPHGVIIRTLAPFGLKEWARNFRWIIKRELATFRRLRAGDCGRLKVDCRFSICAVILQFLALSGI